MTFSEQRLKILPRWFTGTEWANGTAESELQAEYEVACRREQAIENSKTPQQKAADHRASQKKRFDRWFQWSLEKDKYEY
jgi:hypothetical protein